MSTGDMGAAAPASRTGILERGAGYMDGLRALPKHLTLKSVSAGTVAAIFGCTGPALIIIGAAEAGGLTSAQTVSWLFAVYFLGGLISLVMAPYYMQPVVGAYSIPGAAMLLGALKSFDFSHAVGAFIMAGVLVLLLGVSGLIGRVMRWLPMPIIMAMIAGALIRFATSTVTAAEAAPLLVGATIVAFFVTMRLSKSFPPVLAALIVGIAVAAATGAFQPVDGPVAFVLPTLTTPSFSLDAFLAVSVPLAILVIGAENAQATGVLLAEGYRPPVNAMTVVSGIGGILAGVLGGHNANIAGPMTAICSSEQAGEDRRGRYAAAVVNGVLFGSFGIFAGIAVPFVLALPKALIATVAGLAMIGVLVASFQQAFTRSQGHQIGAFVALAVAMSDIRLLSISAPFWALVLGVAVSLLVERHAGRTAPGPTGDR
ncbi:benzoate/H(+) symporter BenE family transporter [Azospirillum picis]|uniref:Benzoate membrane transport protein n=1 Tax=Azospirillum picis TaxID=488438 RepID=A0ABU0MVA0_9PROT|nr:benzoate/H(+) symporter BenE family transporter [Azospirillum picis]MBP2303580.1 benzoate membrane transport protein [Azospirillum picis]MDQ0537428.1 benzoate membrane transport protein [Azospirillum picis]